MRYGLRAELIAAQAANLAAPLFDEETDSILDPRRILNEDELPQFIDYADSKGNNKKKSQLADDLAIEEAREVFTNEIHEAQKVSTYLLVSPSAKGIQNGTTLGERMDMLDMEPSSTEVLPAVTFGPIASPPNVRKNTADYWKARFLACDERRIQLESLHVRPSELGLLTTPDFVPSGKKRKRNFTDKHGSLNLQEMLALREEADAAEAAAKEQRDANARSRLERFETATREVEELVIAFRACHTPEAGAGTSSGAGTSAGTGTSAGLGEILVSSEDSSGGESSDDGDSSATASVDDD
ncbi:hypothetical protein CYMTET_7118 [Cymbomonas tetramitiformis]|uniref:Uncharacterized protein n=2 Tax=Cymbomonas tetramitiformis TaxID=36881 RepID=A0AAE0GVL9_9CHLO|nr:hypothetical protein CYMTET_7118 [Cymbomonas tetramitiformis]